jgi:hypothetical protein
MSYEIADREGSKRIRGSVSMRSIFLMLDS